MLKRKINFLSIKSRSEIEEEIRNLIRRQKFYPRNTIFDLRIFFIVEILSRDYKIEVSEIYSGTDVTITGKTNLFVELTMWIAFIAFLYQLFKLTISNEVIDYIDLLMPLVWVICQGCIFFLPIKKDLNFMKLKFR